MKCAPLCAMVMLLSIGFPLAAETFVIPDVGLSLTTPGGWEHEENKSFGYDIALADKQAPQSKQRKIRVHVVQDDAKNLAQALEKMIEVVTKKFPDSSSTRKYFLGAAEVRTKSGIDGLKGSFGGADENGVMRYSINHYYFKNEAGRIVCVCAYVWGEEDVAKQYEEIILEGLRFSKK
jgi:hypothetical protein